MTSSVQARSLWINLPGRPQADVNSLARAPSRCDVSQLWPKGCSTTLARCWVCVPLPGRCNWGERAKGRGERIVLYTERTEEECLSDVLRSLRGTSWDDDRTQESRATRQASFSGGWATRHCLIRVWKMLCRQSILLLFCLTMLVATLTSLCFSSLISFWFSLFYQRSLGWSVKYEWGRWVHTGGM